MGDGIQRMSESSQDLTASKLLLILMDLGLLGIHQRYQRGLTLSTQISAETCRGSQHWHQNRRHCPTSEATTIMSNPNDPRDASLETRVTFPKSWGRDEAG